MNRYDEYIERMCRTGQYTPDEARKMALSKEVEKYYKDTVQDKMVASIYTPTGECR